MAKVSKRNGKRSGRMLKKAAARSKGAVYDQAFKRDWHELLAIVRTVR